MTTVHCRILMPPSTGQVRGTLQVRILDATRQDAAATTVGSTEVPDATLSADGFLDVAVDLNTQVVDQGALQMLSVEAHLDVDGSGNTSVGDYRTMHHIAVHPRGTESGSPIAVHLRQVT